MNITSQIKRNVEAVVSSQAQLLVDFRTKHIGGDTNVLNTIDMNSYHGSFSGLFDVQSPADNTGGRDLLQLRFKIISLGQNHGVTETYRTTRVLNGDFK